MTWFVKDSVYLYSINIFASMSSKEENLTIRERYRNEVQKFLQLESSGLRHDLKSFQELVASSLKGFKFLQSIVEDLSLFSSNENLEEISTSALPFVAIHYYESRLMMEILPDSNGNMFDSNNMLEMKQKSLRIAFLKLARFLHDLEALGNILTKEQVVKFNSFENGFDPSETRILNNPVTRRAEKIANFKIERELRQKLEILDDYYAKSNNDIGSEDIFMSLDEEVVRTIYIDQLKYFALKSFENLELITLELQVLGNRPTFERQKIHRVLKQDESDELGYTTRLEVDPNKPKKISDILTKQGKILQPFTITNNKQELRKQVFGTGQVLPSMTVEEYLDYELSNGKMLKEESSTKNYSSEDEDSEAEIERREWDDWKDDHPKGSGNIKGNIG